MSEQKDFKTFIDQNSEKGLMIVNGQTLNLFDIQPEQVEISKIVKGLQGVIRFNGYSGESVAQHSYFLSFIAERIMLDKHKKGIVSLKAVAKTAYDALIHDFTEALTGDIIRPFKRLVPEISKIEERIDKQIRRIHSAYDEMPPVVDVLDKQLATIEAYFLSRFCNKTIINELDLFQVKAFNSVFSAENQHSRQIALDYFLNEQDDLDKPLSNTVILKFVNLSGVDFYDVLTMPNEILLQKFVQRAEALKAQFM